MDRRKNDAINSSVSVQTKSTLGRDSNMHRNMVAYLPDAIVFFLRSQFYCPLFS